MKYALLLLALPLAGCLTAGPRKPMAPDALYKFVRPKVVELVFDPKSKGVKDLEHYAGLTQKDFNKDRGFCTAFLVGDDVLMTAHHCVQGFVDVTSHYFAKTNDGKRHKINRLLGVDLKHDVALLEVKDMEKYGKLDFAPQTRVGSKVYTVGNVLGEGIAIRDGLVSSISPDPDNPEIQFLRYSAAASPGNSGGPLVDARGDVVALVFASANRSENFNVGSLAKDLKATFKKFAEDRGRKTVTIDSEDHHYFQPPTQYAMLRVPVPPAWTEEPDALKILEHLKYDAKFPDTIDGYIGATAKGASASAIAARAEASKIAEKKVDPRHMCSCQRTWESIVSAKMPLVIPSQVSRDYQLVELGPDGKHPLPRFGFMAPPSPPPDPAIFKALLAAAGIKDGGDELLEELGGGGGASAVEARAMRTRSSTPKDLKLGPGDEFMTSIPPDIKMPLDELAYGTWLFGRTRAVAPGGNWAAARAPTAEELMSGLTRNGGLVFDTLHELVRPKSVHEFTITKLTEKPLKSEVTDPLGRKWTVHYWTMFDRMTIEAYCLPLPQGWGCAVLGNPATDKPLLAVDRTNTVKFMLQNLLVQPSFWDTDALVDFAAKGHAAADPLMKDFTIAKSGTGLSVHLKTLNVELPWPGSTPPTAVRLTSGLQKTDKGARWVALGYEGVVPTPSGQKLCGVGIDLPNTDAVHLLHIERRGGKAQLDTNRVFSAKIGDKLAYGWCAPLDRKYARFDRMEAFNVAAR